MADRRVTHTSKDADGDITGLCNPSSDWRQVSKSEAIRHIRLKTHRYYVESNGHRSDVHVVHRRSGAYLRTDPDPTGANDLDNLPDC